MPCVFCISSCFPIIEKYIERPYIVNGKHLVIQDKEQNKIVKYKLRRILQVESKYPNRFEQKITLIEKVIRQELNCENNVKNQNTYLTFTRIGYKLLAVKNNDC